MRARYIVRTLLFSIPTLFVLVTLTFILMRLIPGNPVNNMLGTNWDPAVYQSLYHAYGFDQPLYVQYFKWIANLAQGNLGLSIYGGQPVVSMIFSRLPITLEVTLVSMLVAIAIGFPAGILSATHRNTKTDYTVMTMAVAGLSIPSFFLSVLVMLGFGLYLRVLPASGFVYFAQDPMSNLEHMILPAFALGVASAATIARLVRSSMLEVLSLDYVRTARSKGLKERRIVWSHALRNALLPVITTIGLQFGFLMGGAVIIEQIFTIPGMGQLGISAILSRDYPVVQGFILVFGLIFILVNLVVDVVYTFVDPRIKV